MEEDLIIIVDKLAKLTPQWLAGFFDGEGCVFAGSQNNPKHKILKVCIVQKDQELINLLCVKFVGGYIQGKRNRSGVFQITWNERNCEKILDFIKDHVFLKKRQVDAALNWIKILKSRYGSYTEEHLASIDSCYNIINEEKRDAIYEEASEILAE